jgi:hypothetical protein
MAEKVVLTHAEVITLSQDTTNVIRENKSDRGTLLTFKIKTRVNDRVQNSPCIYRTCTFAAETQEAIDKLKTAVTAGAILEIKGRTDKYNSKHTNRWVEVIRVSDALQISEQAPVRTDVPSAEPSVPKDTIPF